MDMWVFSWQEQASEWPEPRSWARLSPGNGDPMKHPLGMPTRTCVEMQ